MKRNISILFLGLLFSISGYSEDAIDMTQALTTAKVTGACGAIQSLAQFQESRQMDGGNAFIVGFLRYEAERLNVSPEEYLNMCLKASAAHHLVLDAVKK